MKLWQVAVSLTNSKNKHNLCISPPLSQTVQPPSLRPPPQLFPRITILEGSRLPVYYFSCPVPASSLTTSKKPIPPPTLVTVYATAVT